MYILKRSVAVTADAREAEWIGRYKREESNRNEDLSRWVAFYKSNPAFGVKLCGNPCLVMPYGIEIPSDERTHTLVRGEIKDLLTKFAKKGFFYEDLRWRHILRDYNNNLFLVDLESLTGPVKSATEKWVANVVSNQVDELLKSATVTPSPAAAVVQVEGAPTTHKRKR
jgi:hypothetical protein